MCESEAFQIPVMFKKMLMWRKRYLLLVEDRYYIENFKKTNIHQSTCLKRICPFKIKQKKFKIWDKKSFVKKNDTKKAKDTKTFIKVDLPTNIVASQDILINKEINNNNKIYMTSKAPV